MKPGDLVRVNMGTLGMTPNPGNASETNAQVHYAYHDDLLLVLATYASQDINEIMVLTSNGKYGWIVRNGVKSVP